MASLITLLPPLFLATFILGTLPLYLPLSPSSPILTLLSSLGSGLLIGAALGVVIPEGIESLLGGEEEELGREHHRNVGSGERSSSVGETVGAAVVAGFVVMFIIDRLQSHLSSKCTSSYLPTHHSRRYLGYSDAEEVDLTITDEVSTLSDCDEASEIFDQNGYNEAPRKVHDLESEMATLSPSLKPLPLKKPQKPLSIRAFSNRSSNSNLRRDSSTPLFNGRRGGINSISAHLSTIVGLLVHSLADGVSLGASSAASSGKSSSLSLTVFFAIIIHKLPAALGLTTLLIAPSNPLSHQDARKVLFLFSAAAPLGAVITYMIVGLLGSSEDEDGLNGSDLGWWTGVALLFSGGTFLFVSTSHLKDGHDEGDEDEQVKNKKWSATLIGIVLPLFLGWIWGGHHHHND